MGHRTTIVLDDESREAARELARELGCSTSEVIRRAIVRYRDLKQGVPPHLRKRRAEALRRWIELSEGMDAEAEVARIKAEDEGF